MTDPCQIAATLADALSADGLPATWNGSAEVALITTADAHMWVYPPSLAWPDAAGQPRRVVLNLARWDEIVAETVAMFRAAAARAAVHAAVDELCTALQLVGIGAVANIDAGSGLAAIYAWTGRDEGHRAKTTITVSARDYRWRAPDGREHHLIHDTDDAVARTAALITRQLRGDQ